MRFLNKLPSLSNVAVGQRATLTCPLGLRYDAIYLTHNVANLALIKNIEVIVNGKVIQSFKDAAEVKAINDYYGRPEQSGVLTLWFYRPEMATPFDRRLPALGTLDVQTLTVAMDLDATIAPAPTLEAVALQGPQEPMGLITKIKSYSSSYAISGKVEIDNIVRSGRIAAIHLFKADVSAVELDVNSRRVVDLTKTLSEKVQKDYGRVPVTASATHIDFTLEGDIAEALITEGIYDLRIRPTLGTSGALRSVVEYLDGFAGI